MANFTDEQIAQLSGNQNVQWVSRTGVQFTPEFKLLAWEQKQQGRRMKDIFRDNGIDPDILGRKRIENFSVRLDDAVREGRFLPDRRIYNRRTDTVQTARYLVSAAAEFTAGVKNCKYNFDCRNTLLWVNTDRNTTTVICNGH